MIQWVDLNPPERRWLATHGGRAPEDVYRFKDRKYCMMGNGHGGYKRIYLPVFKNQTI